MGIPRPRLIPRHSRQGQSKETCLGWGLRNAEPLKHDLGTTGGARIVKAESYANHCWSCKGHNVDGREPGNTHLKLSFPIGASSSSSGKASNTSTASIPASMSKDEIVHSHISSENPQLSQVAILLSSSALSQKSSPRPTALFL